MMKKIMFGGVLTGALLSLAMPSYSVPLEGDPLPVNVFSSWYQANKVDNLKYRIALIQPKDGYYLESRPAPGFSDCYVYTTSVVNPTLIQIKPTQYLLNQQIDSPAKKTTRIGLIDLTSGEQTILSSGSEADDAKNFYPLNLKSVNNSGGFTANGVLPLDEKLVNDGRCNFQAAEIEGSGDTFKLTSLSGLPAKSTKKPASAILAEGTHYVMTMESGESLKIPGIMRTRYNIIKKVGNDPKDWKITETSGFLDDVMYMPDPSLTSVMIPREGNARKSEGLQASKLRKRPVTAKAQQQLGGLDPAADEILFCDLDSEKGCVAAPPFQQGLTAVGALKASPFYEGFNKTLQLYLVSYQNPETRGAGNRCLFFVDFKTELIEIPDKCVIKLPGDGSQYNSIFWAGVSDDKKYLYVISDPREQMMYISFNHRGTWSEFRTLHDVALELQIQRLTPAYPQYFIDSINQSSPGELVITGSLTVAGDTNAKRNAFIVNFKNGTEENPSFINIPMDRNQL